MVILIIPDISLKTRRRCRDPDSAEGDTVNDAAKTNGCWCLLGRKHNHKTKVKAHDY